MNKMMKNSRAIAVKIENLWIEMAKEFAADHHVPERREAIFLDTLATLATAKYLGWADYATDFENSEISLAVTRVLNSWGDLLVPPYGRLVCLGITPEQENIILPLDRPDDAIGFIIARVLENLEEIELVAFVADHQESLLGREIAIETLPDSETLLEELYFLSEENEALEEDFSDNDILKDLDLRDIIRRLNRIYANSPEADWLEVGGSVLAQSETELTVAGMREEGENHPSTELQFLAEEILDKIKEIRNDL